MITSHPEVKRFEEYNILLAADFVFLSHSLMDFGWWIYFSCIISVFRFLIAEMQND
jgi:hypothetical protein